MGGKKKYINIFGSFTEPFNLVLILPLTQSCKQIVNWHRYCKKWCRTTPSQTVHTNTPGGLMTSVVSGRKPCSSQLPQLEWTPTLQLMFVLSL